jgi:hypothetical protein
LSSISIFRAELDLDWKDRFEDLETVTVNPLLGLTFPAKARRKAESLKFISGSGSQSFEVLRDEKRIEMQALHY